MKLSVLLLVLMIGCRSSEPASGTSVGNPGKLSPTVGEGDGVLLGWAWGYVESIVMTGCGGTTTEIPLEQEIDFDGSEEIAVPAGRYCEAQLMMDELEIGGEWKPDTANLLFHMHVPLNSRLKVRSSHQFTVDEDDLVLEVGGPGWIHEDDLRVGFDGQEFEEDDETTHAIAQAALDDSALWQDDGDGEIDEDERDAGPLASTDEDDVDDAKAKSKEANTGCSSLPSPPSTLLLLLAALLAVGRSSRNKSA